MDGSRSSCVVSLVGAEFDFKRLLGIVDNLSFDWDVLISGDNTFFGNVFNRFLRNVLRNVLSQILNGVVVGDGDFTGDFFDSSFLSVLGHSSSLGDALNSSLILVLDDLLLEWHVFYSAFTLDHFLSSVHSRVYNLLPMHVASADMMSSVVVSVAYNVTANSVSNGVAADGVTADGVADGVTANVVICDMAANVLVSVVSTNLVTINTFAAIPVG